MHLRGAPRAPTPLHLPNTPTLMLTFFSNALSKDVSFDALADLSREQMESFHNELSEVVAALNEVVTTAKNKEAASGIPVDGNWLHRVNTKKRIAIKFATELYSQLHGGTTQIQRAQYKRIYKEQFRLALLEEFGEEELQGLEREVLEKTRAIYQNWIDSTQQSLWFVP